MEGKDFLTVRFEAALVADKALAFFLEPRHQREQLAQKDYPPMLIVYRPSRRESKWGVVP
jgi:hypothetical protein